MKLSTYINSIEDLETLAALGITEAILSPQILSRFGEIDLQQSIDLAQACKKKNIQSICEWDILPTENEFKVIANTLPQDYFSYFDEVRIQDTGVLHYILRKTDLPIQWIAETAHHNIYSLKAMKNYIGNRLSRFVLSLELPLNKIKEFSDQLKVPTEILGFGRILLFYTPRKLVSPLINQKNEGHKIEITANSEESPHRGFPVMQNGHGTFMFNPKDHCLLEYGEKLLDSNLSYLRIDLRHDFNESLLPFIVDGIQKLQRKEEASTDEGLSKDAWVKKIKELSPRPLIRGFASVNKTDHQFIKLKNHRIARSDQGYVGQVLDVKKGSYIAVKIKDNREHIKIGSGLQLRTPEGKVKEVKLTKLFYSNGEHVSEVKDEEIVFINHVGGVSVRTAVYLSSSIQN